MFKQIITIQRNNYLKPYKYIVVTYKKVTEWEITKTEVENEMESFITSTKYNTR